MNTPAPVTQPVALPRDAKPSEILESQPRWRWKKGPRFLWRMCRVDWLAYQAGIPRRRMRLTIPRVAAHYDIPEYVVDRVFLLNDEPGGYEATLDFLRKAGY